MSLAYSEDMIITSESTAKYAQTGTTGTLIVSDSNDVASLALEGHIALTITVGSFPTQTSYSLPSYGIDERYSIPLGAGTSQSVALGTLSLLSFTIPVAGFLVQVNIQPLVTWTPVLTANYLVTGPATLNSQSVQLNGPGSSSSTSISFSDNQPVDVYMSNPELILENLGVSLGFPTLVEGSQILNPVFPISSTNVPPISAGSTKLMSFDPNYYLLFNQLQSTLGGLITVTQQLQSEYDSVASGLQQLQTSYSL